MTERAYENSREVLRLLNNTANPTYSDIFESCFKAQSSKLKARTSLSPRFREKRRSTFELLALKQLSKTLPQVGQDVHTGFESVKSYIIERAYDNSREVSRLLNSTYITKRAYDPSREVSRLLVPSLEGEGLEVASCHVIQVWGGFD